MDDTTVDFSNPAAHLDPYESRAAVARLVEAARTVEQERTNATSGDWANLFDALAPFLGENGRR